MNFGPHSALVDEVLQFARSGAILKPAGDTPQNTTIIHDLADVTTYAWDETYGDQELSWPDIRSREMSRIWALAYQSSDFGPVDEQISAQLDLLSKAAGGQRTGEYQELLDDIVADLHGCLYSRAIQGTRGRFFEQLFDVYRCGGWPCGWDGAYPAGRLAAFMPPNHESGAPSVVAPVQG